MPNKGPEIIARNVIMKAIRHAHYPTTGGQPDEPYATAIEEAVQAQLNAYEEAGVIDHLTTAGATTEPKLKSTSNQGASLAFDTSTADDGLAFFLNGGLAPEAEAILGMAGLLGGKPGVWR